MTIRSLGVRVLTLAALLAAPASALFHTRLVKSIPAANDTVAVAPKQVRLWFSTRPELALTSITITKADDTPVVKLPLHATDDSLSVAGTIPVTLEPGAYVVAWKTASPDGHVVRGKIPFTIAPRRGTSSVKQ
ncbi:MAG: copper resistance CopC family protein [Gemmatimonadota bacterium]